jgi:putative transposase
MNVCRGYKVELDLNDEQRTACFQHAGCSRFAWNWGLARKQEAYKATGKMPTAIDLHKDLNALKQTDYPWMYEVSKCAMQEALRDLDAAYKHAYSRLKEGKRGKKVGWPRFKKRSKAIGGFRLTGHIHIFSDHIQLPRLGLLKLKEDDYLPVGAKVAQATVTEKAGRWYVSVQLEQECGKSATGDGLAIGIDLGIKALATCSDGSVYENPKALRSSLKRLQRASRHHSRKAKGSKKRAKAKQQLAKLHAHLANIRKDALHQATTAIVTKATSQRARALIIEDLNVAGMLKNKHLSRAIADVGLYEFRRQLTYKAEAVGLSVKIVSRWYPSSKTCSCCGWIDEAQTLADRTFVCQQCGVVLDRDFNAACNLAASG